MKPKCGIMGLTEARDNIVVITLVSKHAQLELGAVSTCGQHLVSFVKGCKVWSAQDDEFFIHAEVTLLGGACVGPLLLQNPPIDVILDVLIS